MLCIAFISEKGGTGKTTSCSGIGAALSLKGYRVLCVDLDGQGNLSYSMGVRQAALSSLEVLTGTTSAADAVMHTDQGDLIPASPALSGADLMLTDTGKEYRLREALEPLQDSYDYILLDCPPALGIRTVNALTACTGAIIPAKAEVFSLQGIGSLAQTIQAVKKYCNPKLCIYGILLTQYSGRANISKDMSVLLDEAAEALNTKVYNTHIRVCSALQEAQARQESIIAHKPRSNGAKDYEAVTEEILRDNIRKE